MIVITGATGQLGRAIVQNLITRVPAAEVGVSVRDPAKAEDLARLGVRVRAGDFGQPDGLAYAFEGAAQVLMVSSNGAAQGLDPVAQHRNAIAAAQAAGVRRVVYTAHQATGAGSAFPPMHTHAATEEMLRGSGLKWTSLRNGFYASGGLMFIAEALKTGVLAAPPDGRVSWTAHADLAAAAAVILADEGRFEGPTPPLTGAQALTLEDLARRSGRDVRREVLTEDQMKDRWAARGLPAAMVAISLGFYRAAHRGEFDVVDPTLERLLGRPPIRPEALMRP